MVEENNDFNNEDFGSVFFNIVILLLVLFVVVFVGWSYLMTVYTLTSMHRLDSHLRDNSFYWEDDNEIYTLKEREYREYVWKNNLKDFCNNNVEKDYSIDYVLYDMFECVYKTIIFTPESKSCQHNLNKHEHYLFSVVGSSCPIMSNALNYCEDFKPVENIFTGLYVGYPEYECNYENFKTKEICQKTIYSHDKKEYVVVGNNCKEKVIKNENIT